MAIAQFSVDILGNIQPLLNSIKGAEKRLQSVGKRMEGIGRNLSLSLTTPIVGFGVSIVKTAGDFEAAMKGVQAVSQATGEEFKQLNSLAKRLGATTQFSATEAAKGLEVLARNGLNASQIMDGAADASLNLAAATGKGLAEAADIATDVMLSFGKSAKELPQLINGITGATVKSKFDLTDYAGALAQAGGVAGRVGVELDDFNTAIAATSSAFASGSDAGTSFKTFLIGLNPKSEEAKSLMKELNLEFFDGAGNMKSMADIAGQLESAFGGLSEQQRLQAAETIFGTDAMRTALALADTGKTRFNELAQSIGEVSAADQASTRLGGFSGAMKRLQSAFEGLQLAIAESGLIDFITRLVTKVTGFISKLATLNPTVLRTSTVIAGLAAAIGPLAFAFGKLTAMLPGISSTFKVLALAFSPVVLKIGVIVAAISGLILIGKSIIDTYDEVGRFFTNLWDGVANTFQGAIKFIVDKFNGLLDFFNISTEEIKGFFSETWESVTTTFEGFAKDFKLDELTDNIKKNFIGVVDVAKEAANSVGSFFSGDFMGGGMGGSVDVSGLKVKNTPDFAALSQQLAANAQPLQIPITLAPLKDAGTASLPALIEQMTGLGAAFDQINIQSEVFGQSFDAIGAKTTLLKDKMMQLIEEGMLPTDPVMLALQERLKALNEAGAGVDSMFAQIGTSLLQTAQQAIQSGASFAQAAKQVVKAFISQGVAAAIANTLKGKAGLLGLLAVPIAGAAGAAASALFSKLVPAFASGGIVSGPTLGLIGEYAGARSNPEVIAPLDKLKSMIGDRGGNANVNVNVQDIMIEGDKLRVVFDKTGDKRGFTA